MRISIVGNSGSGKTTLARRVAERTGIAHVELDAFHHLPDWQFAERDDVRARLGAALADAGDWVCDGNYNSTVGDLVRGQADTIVLLSLPKWRVMRRVTGRTLRRALRREELWNGNREPLTNFYRWDPEQNIIRWSWTHHDQYRTQYLEAFEAGIWPQAETLELESDTEIEAWLHSLPATGAGNTGS